MLSALRFVQLFALALWLGGMVFFAFFVAPAAFSVLPTREQAGNLVAAVLPRLYLLGVVCGAAYILSMILEHRLAGRSGGLLWPLLLAGLAILLILLSHFWLGGQMAPLRAQMTSAFGSVDQTPAGHALRAQFGRLHGLSSMLMMADLLLVLVLTFLTARRLQ